LSPLLAQYKGIDGFWGTRASLMLDVVVTAMLVFIPVMVVSIALVKYRRQFRLHKAIQLTLGVVLLIVVSAFEIETRAVGWSARAAASPYWSDGRWNDWIDYSLAVHLLFAVPTPLLWCLVIVQAIRRFPRPPIPNDYSAKHKIWAQIAAAAMVLTAITGCIFYWLAFAAT
jgi:uncharacterized membrane protein YozB (DUF420 family)